MALSRQWMDMADLGICIERGYGGTGFLYYCNLWPDFWNIFISLLNEYVLLVFFPFENPEKWGRINQYENFTKIAPLEAGKELGSVTGCHCSLEESKMSCGSWYKFFWSCRFYYAFRLRSEVMRGKVTTSQSSNLWPSWTFCVGYFLNNRTS